MSALGSVKSFYNVWGCGQYEDKNIPNIPLISAAPLGPIICEVWVLILLGWKFLSTDFDLTENQLPAFHPQASFKPCIFPLYSSKICYTFTIPSRHAPISVFPKSEKFPVLIYRIECRQQTFRFREVTYILLMHVGHEYCIIFLNFTSVEFYISCK
jgi:hypothetical protein